MGVLNEKRCKNVYFIYFNGLSQLYKSGKMFSIVLVCLENFQEYILVNISQLFKLGHMRIYVLTNKHLMHNFTTVSGIVELVSVESFFEEKSTLECNDELKRLFVLHSFMASRPNIKNVILIENNVLLYYSCDDSLNTSMFDERQIYVPFETIDRSIFSIIYIPNVVILGKVLAHYDFDHDITNNLMNIRVNTELINTLPIFVGKDGDDFERFFVTNGFDKFGFIFDAAAIGQHVCGTDLRHTYGNPVNETCIIKYPDEGKIGWRLESGFKKPFIKLHHSRQVIPIFNLHIVSNALKLYC